MNTSRLVPRACRAQGERWYSAMTERIGQATPFTHPHLMKKNEVTPGISETEYETRRRALMKGLNPGTVLVVCGYPTKVMTRDIPYAFRQESNFWFLTGCLEPGAVAVFEKSPSSEATWTLFVEEKNPQKELWEGVMTGTENAKKYFGPTAAVEKKRFAETFRSILKTHSNPTVYLHKTGQTDVETHVKSEAGELKVDSPDILFDALRTCKNYPQLDMHTKSASITDYAFRAAMRSTVPGISEAHIYAVMEYAARIKGAQWLAYPPVIAGGAAGLSLHYVQNMQTLKSGDLLLVDAGAEYWGHPTDVTRTWPVDGVFSEPQRDVYEAVLRIHKQLIDAATPGTTVASLQHLNRVLTARELLHLGVLDKTKGDEEAQAGSPIVSTVFPHAFGHFMGMDIHEQPPPQIRDKLHPRTMHTIEPGMYFPYSDIIPEKYRGISVRIEDNIIIASDGNLNLTQSIPKEIDEIEHEMRDSDKRGELVESFAF
eukprot:TRINITY_DN24533_c0_g1_i1.p1 TRINITY_DN24533_c0_g1~~TRINITY_DN24533_c0_g1_i1.p1  ORF type:complete len:485 (+),score=110.80 TRINITY_DN24533_c0_g1_i1:31-1485(+)